MLYYMGIPHFAYPGSSGWTLRLLSYFSYSDYYCSKHWSTNISLRPWFQFLWVYLIGKFLDHVVILFFNIWKIAILFCKAAVSFYIPTDIAQWFQLPHILTNTCFLLVYACVCLCVYACTQIYKHAFSDMEHLFKCLVICTSFWRTIYSSLLSIFESGCLLFVQL